MLCRKANWLFFKTEPLSGIARFGRCKASKFLFHMSSIKQTCAAHRAVYITNVVQAVYLLRHCRASYVGVLSFTQMTQKMRLFCKTFNRSVDSSNKVLLWHYRSTTHHTLHITPQKIVERCQIWWPRNWSPSINPSIVIYNVEVIPHVSTKVRRWLKGCIPAVLGHQNESDKIVSSVRSQTSTLYSTETVRFRTGVPSWTMIILPSWRTY